MTRKLFNQIHCKQLCHFTHTHTHKVRNDLTKTKRKRGKRLKPSPDNKQSVEETVTENLFFLRLYESGESMCGLGMNKKKKKETKNLINFETRMNLLNTENIEWYA